LEVISIPCPHFQITITQRSKGQSAVAGAAYQSGEKLFSEYDQKTKNYSGKRGILYTEIMLPAHAPPEYANREKLWNSVEAVEKQCGRCSLQPDCKRHFGGQNEAVDAG